MRRYVFGLALCSFCCGGSEPLEGVINTNVVQTLELIRESESGVSRGFNLDGWVSESNDGRSCFQEDFVDPDGVGGIDNQLATLLPLIDLAGEGAVQGLVQNAINEGRLLMFLEVVESASGEHELRVRRGSDTPLLGTDGAILPGQTLALHDEEPILGGGPVTMNGDVLEGGPFRLRLPIVVFTQLYELDLPSAYVRFEYDEYGAMWRGIVGGGVPVPQLIQILETAGNFGPEFDELFGDAVRESGDLMRKEDGTCGEMSAAIGLTAVPAFVWE